MSLAVLVPVLGRPHRVTPLIESFRAATPEPFRLLFIASPGDDEEHRAIERAGGDMLVHDGGYAAKIRAGVQATEEPLLFLGADDLEPAPGWLGHALAVMQDGAPPRWAPSVGAQVVGVNDLIQRRPGRDCHATHFLVTRGYACLPTMDGLAGPLCDRYSHSFTDDEFIGTARHRGAYAYASESVVAHLHPMNGTAPDDDTYRKGRELFFQDRRLFRKRRHLWET